MIIVSLSLGLGVVQPIKTVRLEELRADPHRYDRKMVRIIGQIDSCSGMFCSVCPIEATPTDERREHCISMDFDRWAGTGPDRGAQMNAAFRYADVVMTVRIDTGCLRDDNICTDNATVIHDARVERVTRRRTSAEGLIARREALIDAPPALTETLAAKMREASISLHPDQEIRAFMTRPYTDGTDIAVVCRSQQSRNMRGGWPDSFQGAVLAPSGEDRFKCWLARRTNDDWTVMLN